MCHFHLTMRISQCMGDGGEVLTLVGEGGFLVYLCRELWCDALSA